MKYSKPVRAHSCSFVVSLFIAVLLAIGMAPPAGAQEIENRKSEIENPVSSIASVPLGGIGCGTFRLMADGTLTQATINNNWERPIWDMRGCFASLWTSAGGKTGAVVLARSNQFHLPTIAAVDLTPRFPQALVDYPDASLPVTVSLRAFSPLIPQDIKNSSVPGALFVFTVRNVSHAPVDISVALTWENLLGVGGGRTALSDRTGNTVEAIPSTEGFFGVRMASASRQPSDPDDRTYYNARGSYSLMTQPATPDAQVTTAGWNTLVPTPGWWGRFAADGTVAGTVGPGKTGTTQPAGTVAVKVSLKDKETREIAFAVAWYTPRFYVADGTEYGHFYEKSFADSADAARYLLDNRQSLQALTSEWQNRLLRSTFPPWLDDRLMNDAGPLFTRSMLTRDTGAGKENPGPPQFAMIDRKGLFAPLEKLNYTEALLSDWFPELYLEQIDEALQAQSSAGQLLHQFGSIESGFAAKSSDSENDAGEPGRNALAVLFEIATYYRATHDQAFLNRCYPAAKHAVEFAAGSIETGLWRTDTSSRFWSSTLLIARQLAQIMNDHRFADQCGAWIDKLHLGPDAGADASALANQWLLRSLGLPLLATQDSRKGLGSGVAVMQDVADADAGSVAIIASEMANRGDSEAALAMLHSAKPLSEVPPIDEAVQPGFVANLDLALGAMGTWNVLDALEGFSLDLPAGRVTITPTLIPPQRYLAGPVFTPTFWAWLEYRVALGRGTVIFRMDRFLPVTSPRYAKAGPGEQPKSVGRSQLMSGGGLVVKQFVLPIPAGAAGDVTASLLQSPVAGKTTRDAAGHAVFTFDTPVALNAGQRIEFSIR